MLSHEDTSALGLGHCLQTEKNYGNIIIIAITYCVSFVPSIQLRTRHAFLYLITVATLWGGSIIIIMLCKGIWGSEILSNLHKVAQQIAAELVFPPSLWLQVDALDLPHCCFLQQHHQDRSLGFRSLGVNAETLLLGPWENFSSKAMFWWQLIFSSVYADSGTVGSSALISIW